MLHGLIHVHHMSDLRVGGVLEKNFQKFHQLGIDFKNIVIATYSPDKVTDNDSSIEEACETLLRTSDMFFKAALALNAQIYPLKQASDSAKEVLRIILRNYTAVSWEYDFDSNVSCLRRCKIM
jgi:hypothetical protein